MSPGRRLFFISNKFALNNNTVVVTAVVSDFLLMEDNYGPIWTSNEAKLVATLGGLTSAWPTGSGIDAIGSGLGVIVRLG